jgi:hypothetical protein
MTITRRVADGDLSLVFVFIEIRRQPLSPENSIDGQWKG